MPQHEFDEDNLMMIMNVMKIIIILAPGYASFKITIVVIKVHQKKPWFYVMCKSTSMTKGPGKEV